MGATSANTLFTLAGTIVIDTQTALDDIEEVMTKVNALYTKLESTSWGGFVTEIKNLDDGITNAFDYLGDLQTSIGDTGIEIGNLQSAFETLGEQVNNTGQAIGGNGNSTFKNIMINVAASAIYDMIVALKDLSVEFFKMGITFNATNETLVKSFEEFAGLDTSKAEAFVEKLHDFAKNTPYDINSAATAAYKLLDAGFSGNKVIEQLTMLGEMAGGDSAKFEELANIYGNIVEFGKVRESDVEALAEQGIFLKELLGGNLDDETILAKSVTEAFKRATEEGGQYYNKMAETMESWEGRTEQLNEQLNETAGIVTKPFFESLRDYLIPRVNEELEEFGEFFETFDGGMDGAAQLVGFLLVELFKILLDIAKALTLVSSAVGSIVNAVTWFVDLVKGLLGIQDSKANKVAQAFVPWHNENSPYAMTYEDLNNLQQYVDLLREMNTLSAEWAEGNLADSYYETKMQTLTDKLTELESLLFYETPDGYKDLITDYNNWMSYNESLGTVEPGRLLNVVTDVDMTNMQQSLQDELDKLDLTVPVTITWESGQNWNYGTTDINSFLNGLNLEDYYNSLQEAKVHVGGSTRLVTDNTDVVNALARVESVLYQIEHKTGTTQNVVLNTGALVGALAPSMDAHLGVLGSRKARSG